MKERRGRPKKPLKIRDKKWGKIYTVVSKHHDHWKCVNARQFVYEIPIEDLDEYEMLVKVRIPRR